MSDATEVRLLVFRVGDLLCATEVERVREILPRLQTARIPGAALEVIGVANVRGSLVTVIEGWRVLGRAAPDGADAGETTVLLEVGTTRRVAALTVDEVIDMLVLAGTALEQRQALTGLDPTLVRAVARREGRLVVVLDADALLAPILSD
jgi:purine-binding chemotaxis protein CheW